MYGCRYEFVDYGTGAYLECVYHPLAQYNSVEEIERNYAWPSTQWFDYSEIPDMIKGQEAFPIEEAAPSHS